MDLEKKKSYSGSAVSTINYCSKEGDILTKHTDSVRLYTSVCYFLIHCMALNIYVPIGWINSHSNICCSFPTASFRGKFSGMVTLEIKNVLIKGLYQNKGQLGEKNNKLKIGSGLSENFVLFK